MHVRLADGSTDRATPWDPYTTGLAMKSHLPLDLPVLREEAERLVRERYDAFTEACAKINISIAAFEESGGNPIGIEAMAMLLADLSHYASMAWATRELVRLCGMDPETVAVWCNDGIDRPQWLLTTPEDLIIGGAFIVSDVDEDEPGVLYGDYVHVPGIAGVADRAEAMALCLTTMLDAEEPTCHGEDGQEVRLHT